MIFNHNDDPNNDAPFETIRIGVVSSVDPVKCMARVIFEDRDEVVSHDLAVMVPQTMKTKYYHLPDIDETVVCAFLANGQETGVILGSIYSESDKTPAPMHKRGRKRKGIWIDGKNFIEWVEEKKEFLVRSEKPVRFEVNPAWPDYEDDYDIPDWPTPYEPYSK
ncbi:hypothetical protein [Sporosarcina sp. P33]|uniref:hypothetical protein n=1 Tax=Sporosarcina sp. P33 TaxID=1930764 RepID=UPI0009BFE646|nr:hypothetical protein [Sporosarcina sp. P33]ARD47569.1 hypothetical protein SporoP33_04500 [Sporosarcina sp. P33]